MEVIRTIKPGMPGSRQFPNLTKCSARLQAATPRRPTDRCCAGRAQ
jgi:hypothetical protein